MHYSFIVIKIWYSFYYHYYFLFYFIFFFLGKTGALSPEKFCKQNTPAFSSSDPIDLDQQVGPSNMTDSQSFVDHIQTSSSTSSTKEPIFYKFLLSKEEEDKLNNEYKYKNE